MWELVGGIFDHLCCHAHRRNRREDLLWNRNVQMFQLWIWLQPYSLCRHNHVNIPIGSVGAAVAMSACGGALLEELAYASFA